MAGGFDAGSVYATLGAKVNPAGFVAYDSAMGNAVKSAKNAEDAHNRFGSALSRVTTGLKYTGVAAGAAAVGGIALLGVATLKAAQSAADFEASMRNVNSIAKLSDGALRQVSKSVLAMAGKTGQAPKVLADGLYDIVSSGFKARDGLKILEASAKAATAGLTDTATSTKAVVAVLNSYHLGAQDAAKVSDELFQIVNQGVITFPELASQIGDVLPFASSLGVGLDQLGGSIATITKGGVSASQTMTQVKGIFNQLLSPSTALTKAIKDTGASSAESLLKTKGFQGTLESLVGTTDGSKAAISKLFPDVQALGGVLRLTGNNAKGARDDLKAMSEAAGSTQSAFHEQSKSYEVAAQKFGAAWEAARITVGEKVLPVLTQKLGEWAKGLSSAIDSGQLDKLGEDLAKGAQGALTAIEGIARAVPGIARAMASSLDTVLGVITTIDDAIVLMAETFNKLPGPNIDLTDLKDGIAAINAFRESLRQKPPTIKVHIAGDPADALAALKSIRGTKVEAKVMKILGDNHSARGKLTELEAIGIPPKTAIMLANIANALSGIATIEGAMARMQTYKLLTVEVRRIVTGSLGDALSGPNALTKTPRKAMGRGPGQSETALVGEGRVGREAIIDPVGGWSALVDGPTLMGLPDSAYVIPQDRAYRGRAMGLLAGLAGDLGLQGFAKGKAPKKKKALPIPAAITYAAVDEQAKNTERDNSRKAYTDRRDSVQKYKSRIKDDEKAVSSAKTDKAKKSARTKLADDRQRMKELSAGSSKYPHSLTELRALWQQEERELKVLHAANVEIGRLNTVQQTDAQKMTNASKAGDVTGYNAAQADRQKVLGELKAKYAKALGLAKPGSVMAATIDASLQSVLSDLQDAQQSFADTQSSVDTEANRIFDSGFTDAEKAALSGLDRDIALAALTAGLDDDTAAAGRKSSFLDQVLGADLSGGRAVSDDAIADIAGQVKQARDNLSSLTSGTGTNDSADLQAQIVQANQQRDDALAGAAANAGALAVFGGTGDIGAGGINAMRAASGGPNVTIHYSSLVPAGPQDAARAAGYIVGGLGYQGGVQAPRETVG